MTQVLTANHFQVKIEGLPSEHITFQVKIEGFPSEQITIGSLNITQGLHAKIQEQIIRFHFDQNSLMKKDTFYLTCTEGHTLPYDITIENA